MTITKKNLRALHDFSHLGFTLAFSAAYINGVMEGEHPEIRQHWEAIRDFLLNQAEGTTQR